MDSCHSWKLCFAYLCFAVACGAVAQIERVPEATFPRDGKFRVNREYSSEREGFKHLILRPELRNMCKSIRWLCVRNCNVRQLMCEEMCEGPQSCDCRSSVQVEMRGCKRDCAMEQRKCLRSKQPDKVLPQEKDNEIMIGEERPIIEDMEPPKTAIVGKDNRPSPCSHSASKEYPDGIFRESPQESKYDFFNGKFPRASPERIFEEFSEEFSEVSFDPDQVQNLKGHRDESRTNAIKGESNSGAEFTMDEVPDTPSVSPLKELDSNYTGPNDIEIVSIQP